MLSHEGLISMFAGCLQTGFSLDTVASPLNTFYESGLDSSRWKLLFCSDLVPSLIWVVINILSTVQPVPAKDLTLAGIMLIII